MTTLILVNSRTKYINTRGGTLQMYAQLLPAQPGAVVIWNVNNIEGSATIDSSGLLTAVSNGRVVVFASISGDQFTPPGAVVITISNQDIVPAAISIISLSGTNSIVTDNGTLQLFASVLPVEAVDKSVTWSITGISLNGHAPATVSATGLVTAVLNRDIIVTATSNAVSTVSGSILLDISGQKKVTNIVVSSDVNRILPGDTLQMTATITPLDATDPTVTWSVIDGTGSATIDGTGLLTGVTSGDVTVHATSNDAIGVSGSTSITISALGIAPTGWHVPTQEEVLTLILNWNSDVAGGNALTKPDLNFWTNVHGATNSSGFSSLGAGVRSGLDGFFSELHRVNRVIASDDPGEDLCGALNIDNLSSTMLATLGVDIYKKKDGFSLRFVKDDSVDTGFVTDIDGNTYLTTKIGDQVWTTASSIVTSMNDGTPIPEVIPNEEWIEMTSPAYCWYGTNPTTTIAPTTTLPPHPYGILYNWYAVAYNGPLA